MIRKHGKDWLKFSDECNRTVNGVKKKTVKIKKSYTLHQLEKKCDCEDQCKYAEF